MGKPAIQIENVSKLYHLGAIGYTTLRESINLWWQSRGHRSTTPAPVAGLDPAQLGPIPNTFWAIQNISATIERGQIVGIIGRNGAGKSTLLKILSRITDPSGGRAIVRGRVGSLLEVGAGFHPELSGRDNIFLNGAILGMKKSDIYRQLEQIISFAEVGAFIDTPIKRYSSGMYVRLAFAVAAHLEPEILIVDEVLAVGDARFQKKCLGKMREVASSDGRTVIFVSHNLEAVQRLCTHCMLLERGQLIRYDSTASVLPEYLGTNLPHAAAETWIDVAECPREGTGEARFSRVRFSSRNSEMAGQPYADGPLEIEAVITAPGDTAVQSISIGLRDDFGRPLIGTDIGVFGRTVPLPAGETTIRIRLEQLHLKPGVYSVSLWMARYAGESIGKNDILDYVQKAFDVEVYQLKKEGTRTSIGPSGVVTCNFELVEVSHRNGAGTSHR